MKLLFGSALLLFFAGMAGAQTPASFEGTMQATMQMGGDSVPVSYELKGRRARIEMEIPPTATTVLIDSDKGEQIVLVPQLKAYLVHRITVPTSSTRAPELKDEGSKEMVANHACEDYHLNSERYEGTICFAKDLPSGAFESGFGMMPPDTPALTTLRTAGMPLKVNLHAKGAEASGAPAQTVTMQITKIEPHPVEDARFAIPDGWNELKTPVGR